MISIEQFYPYPPMNLSTGSMIDEFQFPRRRRDDTNVIINQLYQATLIRRAGERDVIRTGGRKNKNEILGLTNARLIKEKHLNGIKYIRDIELVRDIPIRVSAGEFVLVLRTDGRIVAMSDEVEQHLGKSMRSLYTQCMNIYECLDQHDGENLREILCRSSDDEHQMICTLRLPKGKRPSRTREDVKTISMAGHFYSCHDNHHERLFVARCEALVSSHVSGTSSSSNTIVNNTMMKFLLNEDMTISLISSNVKDVLGYSRNEMIGQWFGRFLASEDAEKIPSFQSIDQSSPHSICHCLDFYSNFGENRLTFLCQIRPTRERRSKSVKYTILAQLIDPSMKEEFTKCVSNDPIYPLVPIKLEPISQVSPKSADEQSMANSPTLDMGLLMFDHTHKHSIYSPEQSLSQVVAPFSFNDDFPTYNQTNYHYNLFQIENEHSFKKSLGLNDDIVLIDELMNEFVH